MFRVSHGAINLGGNLREHQLFPSALVLPGFISEVQCVRSSMEVTRAKDMLLLLHSWKEVVSEGYLG